MVHLDTSRYASILEVLATSCQRFADKTAFSCMGQKLSYKELDTYSRNFAAYIQHSTDLKPGDRLAIQLPNTLMYPIVVFGALRAGLVIVNTNPLYSLREMEHQFNDSRAKGLVVLANMARKAQKILKLTCIKHVFVTELGDMHPLVQRHIINLVVKRIKKLVPSYNLPYAVSLRQALQLGSQHEWQECHAQPHELAILQYTGGTTGIAKGAMLTHANLVANMLQARTVIAKTLGEGCETIVAPLPMYHIYTFTVNCMVLMEMGNHSLLIPNPRDLNSFVKELSRNHFTGFVGLNTLFVALCAHPKFKLVDFSALKLTISGGMALTPSAAATWKNITGCPIAEGYGLTETSPVVSLNPPEAIQIGTIGKPMPATEVQVIDLAGKVLAQGEAGELCIRGPQVMRGYWNHAAETAKVFTDDGWLKTGDIAIIQADGYIRLIDRKKDMINISGFNVYPNEIEEVISSHPDVLEVAAIGIPDAVTGEALKVFIVSKSNQINLKELRYWCRQRLTSYKIPKIIEVRSSLPKTNVGKVLRRQLRDESSTKSPS